MATERHLGDMADNGHDDPGLREGAPASAGEPSRTSTAAPPKSIAPAAERARAEAASRRAARDAAEAADTKRTEVGGRGGLDPVRYDDWEIGGRAVDF